MSKKSQHELGELLPQERGLVRDLLRLAARGPIEGVAEDHESDDGIARGLGKDGDLAGGVGVERACSGGLRGVVDRESGPHAVGVIAEVQRVADEREGEERDCAEGEDGGDGERGVFVVGFDCAFGGDDGGDSADGRTYGEQRRELWRKLEEAAEKMHERECERDFNGDQREADAAKVKQIAEEKTRAEKDDSSLQPEFIGGHASAEDRGYSDGVGDDEADDDCPQHIFNVGDDPVMWLWRCGQ